MYGWSKWGGGNKGLVRENLEEWYCQSCAQKQRRELPSYMVEVANRDFVRVCARCRHKMLIDNLKDFWDLLSVIEKDRGKGDDDIVCKGV